MRNVMMTCGERRRMWGKSPNKNGGNRDLATPETFFRNVALMSLSRLAAFVKIPLDLQPVGHFRKV